MFGGCTANVERGATIIKEIRNSVSNRKHAATAGSACTHASDQVCVCVFVFAFVCVFMYVCACVRACGMLVRLATWGGDGRPSALMHEARKSHFVGQPSGEAALEIQRTRVFDSRYVLRDDREPKDPRSLRANRAALVTRRYRWVVRGG